MIYLNCDGLYGCGSHEVPDFPTLQSLLDEMDRLGIWASFATNVSSRDGHNLTGNQLLMQDISETPGAVDRIIPAFAVSPKDLSEPETMAYLTRSLSSGEVGALSIYPATCKFSVRHLERLFLEIERYAPLILVDINEIGGEIGLTELSALAGRFSEMNFVVRGVMWPQYGPVLDLMWRCPNVFVGSSLLHVQFSYTTIRDMIGAERVVFGKGYRSLYGSSMASLMYSDLTDAEKEGVASRTLFSLLPNRVEAERLSGAARELKPKVRNSFWEPFMEGKGVADTLVIDAHGHLGATSGNGWFVPETDIGRQLDRLDESMAKLGVKFIIGSGYLALNGDPAAGNAVIEQQTASRRERYLGYYVYNPLYGDRLTTDLLDRSFAGDYFVGFKTLSDYWHMPVSDPSYRPLWEYADRYRLPILLHSWEGTCDTPAMIAEVARQYPNAIFLDAHSGGGDIGRAQAEKAGVELPNFYLEFCGSFCARRLWEDTLAIVGADKVVWGSDTQGHDQAWELGRLLSTDFCDEDLVKILGKNMEGILAQSLPKK